MHVLPFNGDWADVGSWKSIASLTNQDDKGNAIHVDGFLLSSRNTFIRSESALVAGIVLENLIIIEIRDAILISDAKTTKGVKELVDALIFKERKEATEH